MLTRHSGVNVKLMRLSSSVVLLVAVISSFSAPSCKAEVVAYEHRGPQHAFSAPDGDYSRKADGSADPKRSEYADVKIVDRPHWESRLTADLEEATQSVEVRSGIATEFLSENAVHSTEFGQEAAPQDRQSMVDWLQVRGF